MKEKERENSSEVCECAKKDVTTTPFKPLLCKMSDLTHDKKLLCFALL
jgi:hypothetical protein